MQRFDLELLNTMTTVADTGSLSAAALQLHRSQSAISEQIRKLEQHCGLTLFVRGKRGATPTPAGERLLDHARAMLKLNDMAYRDMQGLSLSGDLRLAITDYFRPVDIARILKRLGDQYPGLRLHVSVRKSALIEADPGDGEFDLGLSMRVLDRSAQREAPRTAFTRIALRREPLQWISSSSFAWPSHGAIPLVGLPDSCSLQRYVLTRLTRAKLPFFVAHSASGVAGLQSAVAAGLGITCLNASAMPPDAVSLSGMRRLPKLPDVEFGLIVPEAANETLAGEVARFLVQHASSTSTFSPLGSWT